MNDYLVIPRDNSKHPGIILIHEIWGLNDHIKDIANRLKDQGYIVLAPDLLSGTGIPENLSPKVMGDQQKMREVTAPTRSPEFAKDTVKKLAECFQRLKQHPSCDGKIAVVGFCFGGTYSYALAAAEPGLAAAAPFYGHAPDEEKIQQIKCPILAFYGGQDTPLMEDLPKIKELMERYHKDFKVEVYPETGHAFFNDTNPTRYNKEASEDAWPKLLNFLKNHL